MNLEVEVHLTSRVIQIRTDSVRVAEAYGNYAETFNEQDLDDLVNLIEADVKEAMEFEITDVRMGHPARPYSRVLGEERE